MQLPSLEDIVERWTISHTVAVAAWAVVVVLGLTLLLRGDKNTYPTTEVRKVYAGENATFTYPENWTVSTCVPDHAFIELPGTIGADYKDDKAYGLEIEGRGSYTCSKGRPERLDLYPETLVASDNPCIPATSTEGERLANGLYLRLAEQDGDVYGLSIHQNSCYAPTGASVLAFSFIDPKAEPGDDAEFGMPRVKQEAFLTSRQYQDIRTLAESIRY